MNKLKEKSGITLIALVITIIVLLILAGISISMLSGDNSILQKATDAKKITGISMVEEQIAIAYNAALIKDLESGNLNLQESTLRRELEKEFTEDDSIGIDTTGENWVVTVNEVTVTVPIKKTGDGQEDNPLVETTEIEPVTLGQAELTSKYGEVVTYTGYSATDVSTWRLYYVDKDFVYLLSDQGEMWNDSYYDYDGGIKEPGLSLNSSKIDWNFYYSNSLRRRVLSPNSKSSGISWKCKRVDIVLQ